MTTATVLISAPLYQSHSIFVYVFSLFFHSSQQQPTATYEGSNVEKTVSTGAVRSILPNLTEERLKAIKMPKKIEL